MRLYNEKKSFFFIVTEPYYWGQWHFTYICKSTTYFRFNIKKLNAIKWKIMSYNYLSSQWFTRVHKPSRALRPPGNNHHGDCHGEAALLATALHTERISFLMNANVPQHLLYLAPNLNCGSCLLLKHIWNCLHAHLKWLTCKGYAWKQAEKKELSLLNLQ